MSVAAVIPARLQSSRCPRKLLKDDTGRPLIQYVWNAAMRARTLDSVIIATDSEEIARVVRRFGGQAEMTGEHASGTDRIAEVVRRGGADVADADIIVNLQGDEPELDPTHIDRLVETLQQHPQDEMATLAVPFASPDDVHNPSCVKVVCTADGRALYFSRSLVPFSRDRTPAEFFETAARRQATSALSDSGLGTRNSGPSPWLLHLGLYAYRRDFLLQLTSLPPSPLEELEKLEQLRALEAGATIRVALVENAAVGIDTPEDYARFVQRQRRAAGQNLF